MLRTSVAAVGLACAVLVVSSCGGKAAAPPGPGGTVSVVEGDIFLDKPEYRVPNGLIQITVKNAGKVHHDLRVRKQAFFVETNAGETAKANVTLTKGTYDLFCSIPGHENAKSNLIVE
jgi:hypothetical protein